MYKGPSWIHIYTYETCRNGSDFMGASYEFFTVLLLEHLTAKLLPPSSQ